MTKTSRLLTIVLWVILAVSAILIISLMVNISENDADPTMGTWINNNIIWAYVLLTVGAGIAVVSGLLKMATDIQAAKKGLISLVILVVVVGLAYVMASDAIPQFVGVDRFVDEGILTPTVSKWIGTGLNVTYILFVIAILSIVVSSVSRLFK